MAQKIYIAVNKNGVPFMFTNSPMRTATGWSGNFYINSVLYEQVCNLIKQADMKWEDEPEILEFQITDKNA